MRVVVTRKVPQIGLELTSISPLYVDANLTFLATLENSERFLIKLLII